MTLLADSPSDTEPSLPIARPAPAEDDNNIPLLQFPRLYIIALAPLCQSDAVKRARQHATGEHWCVFNLENAPAHIFDSWICSIAEKADAHIRHALGQLNRQWRLCDKWSALNALAEASVTLPIYTSEREARAALKALQERQVQQEQENPHE